MSGLDPKSTLADIVTGHPELAHPLGDLGLDFCCHGQRSLAEAAGPLGLDLAQVVARLEAAIEPAAAPVDWAVLEPDALVDHLVSVHHAYLDDALPRLEALGDKVAGVHGERHRELIEVARLVHELAADLGAHLRTEEDVVFPMIRALADAAATSSPGGLATQIEVLDGEHDRAGALLAELRRATGGYVTPGDGCASYRLLYDGLAELEADTHLHVHKENNVLFPAVSRRACELAAEG